MVKTILAAISVSLGARCVVLLCFFFMLCTPDTVLAQKKLLKKKASTKNARIIGKSGSVVLTPMAVPPTPASKEAVDSAVAKELSAKKKMYAIPPLPEMISRADQEALGSNGDFLEKPVILFFSAESSNEGKHKNLRNAILEHIVANNNFIMSHAIYSPQGSSNLAGFAINSLSHWNYIKSLPEMAVFPGYVFTGFETLARPEYAGVKKLSDVIAFHKLTEYQNTPRRNPNPAPVSAPVGNLDPPQTLSQ
jgi:hypothetical protein